MKKIISMAINLFQPPWWHLTKERLALHENMKPTFLFCKNNLLHDA